MKQPFGDDMKLRACLERGLWCGAVAFGIAILSGMLSLVLGAMGDRSGSEAIRGICIVAIAIVMLSLVWLVVVLTLRELNRPDARDQHDSHKPPS